MSEAVYPKGLVAFAPNPKAPDFVIASVKVTPKALVDFIKENAGLLTDYKGDKQLSLQLLSGDKGYYFKVDNFQPSNKQSSPQVDDDDEGLPF